MGRLDIRRPLHSLHAENVYPGLSVVSSVTCSGISMTTLWVPQFRKRWNFEVIRCFRFQNECNLALQAESDTELRVEYMNA